MARGDPWDSQVGSARSLVDESTSWALVTIVERATTAGLGAAFMRRKLLDKGFDPLSLALGLLHLHVVLYLRLSCKLVL